MIYFYEFKTGHSASQTARKISKAKASRKIKTLVSKNLAVVNFLWKYGWSQKSFCYWLRWIKGTGSKFSYSYLGKLNWNTRTIPEKKLPNAKLKKLKQIGTNKLNKNYKRNTIMKVALCYFYAKKNDLFLEPMVTCDEKWIVYNNRWRRTEINLLHTFQS